MTCEDREVQLLLYVHNELSPIERLTTALHLAFCSRCRARVKRDANLSTLAAHTIMSGSSATVSRRHPIGSAGPRTSIYIAVIVAGIVLFVGIAAYYISGAASRVHKPVTIPCSPGLPNSDCR